MKTTTGGIIMIIIAVLSTVVKIINGESINPVEPITNITAGIALIQAQDAKPKNKGSQ